MELLGMFLATAYSVVQLNRYFPHIGITLAITAMILIEWVYARALTGKLRDGESLLSLPALILVYMHLVCAGVQRLFAAKLDPSVPTFHLGVAIITLDAMLAFLIVMSTKDTKSTHVSAVSSTFCLVMVGLSTYSL